MRGISLPIETIVIIAIAVLVLVVIVAFFVGGAGQRITAISDQDALTRGCTSYVLTYHCNIANVEKDVENVRISGYNATCDGRAGNTLGIACCKAGFRDPVTCVVSACRCPPQAT